MLDRFSIHQINAPKFLLISLSSVVAEKSHGAMQKLFKKKRKEKKG
jgi:PIN domain nuclease of toxin-antitoxin system